MEIDDAPQNASFEYLVADPRLRCHDDIHNGYKALAAVGLILSVVAVPAGLFAYVYFNGLPSCHVPNSDGHELCCNHQARCLVP